MYFFYLINNNNNNNFWFCFYTDYDGPHHAMVDVRGCGWMGIRMDVWMDGWMLMDELHMCVCVCVCVCVCMDGSHGCSGCMEGVGVDVPMCMEWDRMGICI
jgi:hypothetical protein